ncbi:hypothetical protein BGZ63DRAFT_184927 [Mariannaea sp. PMI_226]|nr:hypothetical protein BGZ63DRAFT_184927 [Mariannaea sp. PMI_226]
MPGSKLKRNRPRSSKRYFDTPGEVERHSLLSGWVKRILPSNRVEQGGTARDQGFWDKHRPEGGSDTQEPRYHASQGHRGTQHGAVYSNQLMHLNIPKTKIDAKTNRPSSRLSLHPDTAGLDASTTTEPGRRWSWVPQDDLEYWRMANRLRNGQDDSSKLPLSPVTHSLLALQVKRDARKERRNLKDDGDYLGVQGFNPQTGVPDIITPSNSDQSSASEETDQKLEALIQLSRVAPSGLPKKIVNKEIRQSLLKRERHKIRRREYAKAVLQQAHSGIRWRKHSKQWSSAQEPTLSPIAQSQGSTSPPLSQLLPILS